MSRFLSSPSPDFQLAVVALNKLPLDQRAAAYAEATSRELEAAAAKKFGKLIHEKKSWRRLIGEPAKPGDHLPADDHTELREGCYISQPYSLNLATLEEIVRVCKEHGLDVQVDAASWHYPGGTLRVIYRAAP